MPLIDEEPVLYRDVAALEAQTVSQPPDVLVSDVHRAADALGQCIPLSVCELDQLRSATRRLRRAIEVRAIVGSCICGSCGETFLRADHGQTHCAACGQRR